MFKVSLAAWGLLALGCEVVDVAGATPGAAPLDLRVMTFNVRNGRARDGLNGWSHRRAQVRDVILDHSPDVLGLQEAYRFQLDHMREDLPGYGELGLGRGGGSKGEYSAILYRTSRVEVGASGTFWLSDTPERPSRHWGNRYLRICTWAHLRDTRSGRMFYVYNTHLDHQSQPAREKSVRLIVQRIGERDGQQDPVVLTGDFNAGEDNVVVRSLQGASSDAPMAFVDSFRVLHPESTEVGTGNRFSGRSNGEKIDYIFVPPGTRVTQASIIRSNVGGRYPSDHYPVTATIRLK